MAQKILANAFSISMLPMEAMNFIRVKKINPNDVPADVESAIGHSDTARVVSNILGFEVTFRKEGCRGCRGYDSGTCQNCVFSFWLSGAPVEKC